MFFHYPKTPALEQGKDENYDFENSEAESEEDFSYGENDNNEDYDYDNENNDFDDDSDTYDQSEAISDMNLDEYLQAEEESYKTQDNNYSTDDEEKNFPIAAGTTFVEFFGNTIGFSQTF